MEMKRQEVRRTAIVFGASGLVGNHCVHLLLQNSMYDRISIFTRKATSISHPKVTEYLINFDAPESQFPSLTGDDLFWCLGTTIKRAGTREKFKQVDYDYALKFGQLAHKEGVHQFLLVSALGADSGSQIFYNQVKGELEDALKQLQYQALHIFRPSLLLGERGEFRAAEKVAQLTAPFLTPLLLGPLKKYRPIQAKTVARAMMVEAPTQKSGTFIYESDEIQKIGQ